MSDSLLIGVDCAEKDMMCINVFRRNGNSFELVKVFSGSEALQLYDTLTKNGDETLVAEVKM